jgi:hypothetical protein
MVAEGKPGIEPNASAWVGRGAERGNTGNGSSTKRDGPNLGRWCERHEMRGTGNTRIFFIALLRDITQKAATRGRWREKHGLSVPRHYR